MPGRNEIIVGVSAARQYAGLDVGDMVQARTATLEVVGHFVAEGTAVESEIWMDRAIGQSVFRRTATVSVARVKLAPDVDVKATVLALAGGILGAAVAYAVLDGYTASTLNPAAGSQLAFAFQVTPESIRLSLGWAMHSRPFGAGTV